ncbi:MAG: SsrA-binding protein SmpB [bacterium]|nr:SsrA-binding protein SmpB [bacterium]
MASKDRFSNSVSIKNRKAFHEFTISDTYEAGMILKGTEIKSIREGKVSLQEAYCHISNDEIFVKGMTISPYSQGSFTNHEPTRERKLLLNKREIEKLRAKTEEKGFTIVPTKLYINKRGFAKLEVGLAKGKNLYDKRDSMKKKDQDRELKQLKY